MHNRPMSEISFWLFIASYKVLKRWLSSFSNRCCRGASRREIYYYVRRHLLSLLLQNESNRRGRETNRKGTRDLYCWGHGTFNHEMTRLYEVVSNKVLLQFWSTRDICWSDEMLSRRFIAGYGIFEIDVFNSSGAGGSDRKQWYDWKIWPNHVWSFGVDQADHRYFERSEFR